MKMNMQVLGAKIGKGSFEGTDYDYTKVRVMMDCPPDSKTEFGYDSVDMKFGKSDNGALFEGLKFPCAAELDVVMTTKGNEIVGFRPLAAAAKV